MPPNRLPHHSIRETVRVNFIISCGLFFQYFTRLCLDFLLCLLTSVLRLLFQSYEEVALCVIYLLVNAGYNDIEIVIR